MTTQADKVTKVVNEEVNSGLLGLGIAAAICGRARRVLTNPLFSSIMEWGK
jgi:hypothetical protein